MNTPFPALLLHEPAQDIVIAPDTVASLQHAHRSALQENGRRLFAVRAPIAIAEAFEEAAESSKLLWIYAGDKQHVDLVTWNDPTLLHECLHGTFVQLLYSECFRLFKDTEAILSLRMLGATKAQLSYGNVTIGKGADASIVPSAWLPSRDDPDQAGVVIFEGAVYHDNIDRVVLELLFWLQAPRCQVAVAIKILKVQGAPQMIAFAVEATESGPLFHVPKAFGRGTKCLSANAEGFRIALAARVLLAPSPYAQTHQAEVESGTLALPLWPLREQTYIHLGLDPSQEDRCEDSGFQDAEKAIYKLIESEDAQGRKVNYAKTFRRDGTRAANAAQTRVKIG